MRIRITKKFCFACMIFYVSIAAISVSAEQIMFTHEGIGADGSIGGQSFTDMDFVFQATADTEDLISFSGGFTIQHLEATVELFGLGTFEFLTDTRTFVNNNLEIVGFSRSTDGGNGGLDLYQGPGNSVFGTWDIVSAIGPISGTSDLLQWGGEDVITTGGVVAFETQVLSGTFTATVVPEPSSAGLIGIGVFAIFRRGRL